VNQELKSLQLKLATIDKAHKQELDVQAKRYEDKIGRYDQISANKIKAVQDVLTKQIDTV